MDKLGTVLLAVRDEAEWTGTKDLLAEEFGYRVVIVRSPAERTAALRDIHIDLAIAEDASGFDDRGFLSSLTERVERALEGVRPMLASHGGDVELVKVEPPAIDVRFIFEAKGDNRWSAAARDSLCWPYGVAASAGTLAIADSGNNRVLLWDVAP